MSRSSADVALQQRFLELARSGPVVTQYIARVHQLALLKGKAAAPDAPGEPVTEALEHADLVLDSRAPRRGQSS